ncbi:MAG: acetyl-CoA hydrolase/transferase C-terminal domain-containing protein [Cyanobacteriota bacterium]
MSWEILYEKKKVSIEDAIKKIKSGDRVVVGQAAGDSFPLTKELVNQRDRLKDVQLIQNIALGKAEQCQEPMEDSIKYKTFFVGPGSRKSVAERRSEFIPSYFSELPRLFNEKIIPVDVAILHLSPPNENGYLSYGTSPDYIKAGAENAKMIIAEVNQQMPYTYGSLIHVSELNYLVETDRPLYELQPAKLTEVEESIGKSVAELIPDGANLQLGIGGIPDAILNYLYDKKDLGIHTEMFSDGVIDLYEKGVITNKYNNLNPGRFTTTFVMGTRKLYDFVHKNEAINFYPVDYTNSIMIAARVNNLISINSAIQVDLHGQVCADTIGYTQYSGVGGQVDFVKAASLSKGGKSIIALSSTAKNNTISRIVLKLTDGACVTTSRHDVHYVATEYGIVNLKGKSVEDRAKSLIGLAHPNFRDQLTREACEAGMIKKSEAYALTK